MKPRILLQSDQIQSWNDLSLADFKGKSSVSVLKLCCYWYGNFYYILCQLKKIDVSNLVALWYTWYIWNATCRDFTVPPVTPPLLFLVLSKFPHLDKIILPGLVSIGPFNKICWAGGPVQSCHILPISSMCVS